MPQQFFGQRPHVPHQISSFFRCEAVLHQHFERGQDESEYTGEYPYAASSCIPDGSKRRTDSNESLRWCDGRNQEEQVMGETEEARAYCSAAESIYGFPKRGQGARRLASGGYGIAWHRHENWRMSGASLGGSGF